MDPLSDVLRVVRLDGAFFYAVEAAEPWSVEAVAAKDLSPRILPTAEHLISYHILMQGQCYGGVIGEEQVEMLPGDVIVFPHGDPHVMSSGRGIRIGPDVHSSAPARYPHTVLLGDQGPRVTSFLCGFLGCDRRPFNPLLAALPRRLHMRGVSSPWFAAFTRQLTEESRVGRPGAEVPVLAPTPMPDDDQVQLRELTQDGIGRGVAVQPAALLLECLLQLVRVDAGRGNVRTETIHGQHRQREQHTLAKVGYAKCDLSRMPLRSCSATT